MMTIADLRRWGRESLEGEPTVIGLEVDVLLAHVLGAARSELYSRGSSSVSRNDETHFRTLVARRKNHEPIAYLVGEKEFFGRSFAVSPSVLIPRPESELLVEQALARIAAGPCLVIDVGTGSGALIVSLLAEARERWGDEVCRQITAVATDSSARALEVARGNAGRYALATGIDFRCTDLLQGVRAPREDERCVIMSNPPYVAEAEELAPEIELFEPRIALRAGPDGLDIFRRLLSQVHSFLRQRATLLVEIGYSQGPDVECALKSVGLTRYNFHCDLDGHERVVEVTG